MASSSSSCSSTTTTTWSSTAATAAVRCTSSSFDRVGWPIPSPPPQQQQQCQHEQQSLKKNTLLSTLNVPIRSKQRIDEGRNMELLESVMSSHQMQDRHYRHRHYRRRCHLQQPRYVGSTKMRNRNSQCVSDQNHDYLTPTECQEAFFSTTTNPLSCLNVPRGGDDDDDDGGGGAIFHEENDIEEEESDGTTTSTSSSETEGDDDDDDDDDGVVNVKKQANDPDQQQAPQSNINNNQSDAEDEEEVAAEEEAEQEDVEEQNTVVSKTSAEPVTITMSTSLEDYNATPLSATTATTASSSISSAKPKAHIKLLDQSLELAVSPSRNIASLKQSLHRQWPGKPPLELIHLRWNGRLLGDDEVIQDLLEELEEDKDDEEEEVEGSRLTLLVDMIPPLDAKAPLLPKLQEMTTWQLLQAYALHEAALYQNAAMMATSVSLSANDQQARNKVAKPVGGDDNEEEIVEDEDETTVKTFIKPSTTALLVTKPIRQHAAIIQTDLERMLSASPSAERAWELLHDARTQTQKHADELHGPPEIRGNRIRATAGGGGGGGGSNNGQGRWHITFRTTNHWFHTTLIPVFWWWFLARNAPDPRNQQLLLFVIPFYIAWQHIREFRHWLKTIVYLLLIDPPSIVLSLLPAPQQVIFSLNFGKAMQELYGDSFGKAKVPPVAVPITTENIIQEQNPVVTSAPSSVSTTITTQRDTVPQVDDESEGEYEYESEDEETE